MTNIDFHKILSENPQYVTWADGADLVTRLLFPVAARTLRTWGMRPIYPNGRAVLNTADLLNEAKTRCENASRVPPRGANLSDKQAKHSSAVEDPAAA